MRGYKEFSQNDCDGASEKKICEDTGTVTPMDNRNLWGIFNNSLVRWADARGSA
jgi:hypothetical protein